LLLIFLGVACGREEAPVPTQPEPGQPSRALAPPAKPTLPMATLPQPVVGPTPEQVRLRAIAAIPSRAKGPDEALKELQPWLDEEDRDAREAAILALWDIETNSANEQLAKVARNDADPEIKSYALEELVDREAPQALDALTHLLNDPEPDLREQAAEGLEALEDTRATPQLYNALKGEKDEWVRDAIMSALENLDPDFDEDAYEED
jgi:HEAT repeat protein